MQTKSYSSYWLDNDIFDEDTFEDEKPENNTNIERILRLAAARRAVSNFVNILTGRNDIPVKFSSGQMSYTDGKQVIIAADDNPEHFDSMVGLALHEASHILLTDFEHLKTVQLLKNGGVTTWTFNTSNTEFKSVAFSLFHPQLAKLLPPYVHKYTTEAEKMDNLRHTTVVSRMINDIHMIMNILEDRRIDKFVYQNASGYRPYYKALYDRYFWTAEIGKNLQYNPAWRKITVENYINRLLYAFHPAAKLDAMPGLKQLVKLMDLDNIDRIAKEHNPVTSEPHRQWTGTDYEDVPREVPRWSVSYKFKDQPILWQEANKIYAYILKFVQLKLENDEENGMVTTGITGDMVKDNLDLPNLDGMPTADEMTETAPETGRGGKPGKFNGSKADKDLKKAMDALDGNVKKKKATKAEQQAVDAADSADAKMVDISGHGVPYGKCMVTRKLTEEMFKQDWFLFSRYDWESSNQYIEASVAAGKRMGAILLHRLQVRNDPVTTRQTRLPHGGIDKRLLSQLGMDIESVFYKQRTDSHKPVMLHLTLDASGSMQGRKWEKVRTVAVALAYLGSKMRNVDVVITIRGGGSIPIVSVIFDSRRDQFPKFIRNVKRLTANGGTPEGLCYAATLDLILESADTHDVYFINFSDGEPSWAITKKDAGLTGKTPRYYSYDSAFSYYGEVAFKHTATMIRMMRERGVKILSYFIAEDTKWHMHRYSVNKTGSVANFKQMYGEDAEFINVENVSEVLRTLNKLLLVRG